MNVHLYTSYTWNTLCTMYAMCTLYTLCVHAKYRYTRCTMHVMRTNIQCMHRVQYTMHTIHKFYTAHVLHSMLTVYSLYTDYELVNSHNGTLIYGADLGQQTLMDTTIH